MLCIATVVIINGMEKFELLKLGLMTNFDQLLEKTSEKNFFENWIRMFFLCFASCLIEFQKKKLKSNKKKIKKKAEKSHLCYSLQAKKYYK